MLVLALRDSRLLFRAFARKARRRSYHRVSYNIVELPSETISHSETSGNIILFALSLIALFIAAIITYPSPIARPRILLSTNAERVSSFHTFDRFNWRYHRRIVVPTRFSRFLPRARYKRKTNFPLNSHPRLRFISVWYETYVCACLAMYMCTIPTYVFPFEARKNRFNEPENRSTVITKE